MEKGRELVFEACFGDAQKTVRLWETVRGGSRHIYIDGYVAGSIIEYDSGWRVFLKGSEFEQGDADQLLEIIGVPVSEMDHIKGYRNPLWPDWYIKELDILGL